MPRPGMSDGRVFTNYSSNCELNINVQNSASSNNNVEYKKQPVFELDIPTSCPEVPSEILNPIDTWADKSAFEKRVIRLLSNFP